MPLLMLCLYVVCVLHATSRVLFFYQTLLLLIKYWQCHVLGEKNKCRPYIYLAETALEGIVGRRGKALNHTSNAMLVFAYVMGYWTSTHVIDLIFGLRISYVM
jgi:hypothetical protein